MSLRIMVDLTQVKEAAVFIANNNPHNFEYSDVLKSITKSIKTGLDEKLRFSATMGYFVHFEHDDDVVYVSVYVDSNIGAHEAESKTFKSFEKFEKKLNK